MESKKSMLIITNCGGMDSVGKKKRRGGRGLIIFVAGMEWRVVKERM